MTPDQRVGIIQKEHQIKDLEYQRKDTRSKNWNTIKKTPDQRPGILLKGHQIKDIEYYIQRTPDKITGIQ